MVKIKKILKSFRFSLRGTIKIFKQEQNFKIHTLAAFSALVLSFLLKVSAMEFIVILLIISGIFILELINTVLERMVDLIQPRLHVYVEDIKDMSAAAVMIGALAAALAGIVIFLPKIIAIFI